MSEKHKMKYEKPISIDMGRVAPVLGDRCSTGQDAFGTCAMGLGAQNGDCSMGYGNSSIVVCNVGGKDANACTTGNGALRFGCDVGDDPA